MTTVKTEERILQAAESIFTLNGLEGARMQDIADAAGINKAMLHYYFRNKETLFDTVLNSKIEKVFGAFSHWFEEGLSLENRLRNFVAREITIISEFPILPLFVLMEARKHPDLISRKFGLLPIHEMRSKFQAMIDSEYGEGRMRKTSMEEMLINTVSLCIYPVVAAPVFQFILNINDENYQDLLEQRKTQVADFLIRDLQITSKVL
ncbi:MAG: TetR/AcrR family transcriptional regulator [Saprospiraceae bacterium]|nr:TetR/AcrR family transcriptional regulator [Saprospiraceae bacterium]